MSRNLAPLLLTLPLLACAATAPATARATAPAEETFALVPLLNADASETAEVLARALARPDGGHARVVADGRTNSLLVVGRPGEVPLVLEMIAALDSRLR